MARAWFAYNGTGNTLAPSSYTYTVEIPTCINGRGVCAIYSRYVDTLSPGGFSQNLINYVAAGRATGLPQPATPVGSKKYVYFLPFDQ